MASSLRSALGLSESAPINLEQLANSRGIRVIDGGDLIGPEPFAELEALQAWVFSAATFVISGKQVIVTNPTASPGRRQSDVAHELGHILLDHDLTEIREVGGVPFRSCRPEEEEQATAFGGTLLLPRPLLLKEAYAGAATPEAIAKKYGVTIEMARFRLNTTGVVRQVQQSSSRRARGV